MGNLYCTTTAVNAYLPLSIPTEVSSQLTTIIDDASRIIDSKMTVYSGSVPFASVTTTPAVIQTIAKLLAADIAQVRGRLLDRDQLDASGFGPLGRMAMGNIAAINTGEAFIPELGLPHKSFFPALPSYTVTSDDCC